MAFPDPVAPGELIESAWGNNVVDTLFVLAAIRSGAVPGGTAAAGSTLPNAATLSVPAGTHLVSYTVLLSSTAALKVNLKLFVGGASNFLYQFATADIVRSVGFTVPVTVGSAATISIDLENIGTAAVNCFADPVNHRLAAIQGLPR